MDGIDICLTGSGLVCIWNSTETRSLTYCPPEQNGHHFTDDISRCIFVNENFYILIKISLKFVPKGQIDNNPALV